MTQRGRNWAVPSSQRYLRASPALCGAVQDRASVNLTSILHFISFHFRPRGGPGAEDVCCRD